MRCHGKSSTKKIKPHRNRKRDWYLRIKMITSMLQKKKKNPCNPIWSLFKKYPIKYIHTDVKEFSWRFRWTNRWIYTVDWLTTGRSGRTYHFLGQVGYLAVKQRGTAQLHRDVGRAHVYDWFGRGRGRDRRCGPYSHRRLQLDLGRRIGHLQVEFMFYAEKHTNSMRSVYTFPTSSVGFFFSCHRTIEKQYKL